MHALVSLLFRSFASSAGPRLRSARRWVVGALLASLGLGLLPLSAAPRTDHPRLWITPEDLPALRARANTGNPVWVAFQSALDQAVNTYDAVFFPGGQPAVPFPDDGHPNIVGEPVEAYAEIFAFASLVHPVVAQRASYAQRSRRLLMYAIDIAKLGVLPISQQPVGFRDAQFSTYNRANSWGEAWGLTVDWLQASGALTATDLADIRKVFLDWANIQLTAYNHPVPVGATNDPQLLANPANLRAALNNYYTGHMRQLTTMALSIDAADDPPLDPAQPANLLGNTLRSYIPNITGSWLYQQYAVYEQAAKVRAAYGLTGPNNTLGIGHGGLSVEGFLYGLSMSHLLDALECLHTAGYDDVALSGPQIELIRSAFWSQMVDGFLHSLTPSPKTDPTQAYLGPFYQFAGYGDVLRFYITPYNTDPFLALGVLDARLGNTARRDVCRWLVRETTQGGSGQFLSRIANIWGNDTASRTIKHFLLFDPALPVPVDPRPALAQTDFFSPTLGRALSRTDWTAQARLFAFKCSFITINHQGGDGGMIEFHRKGEWLFKELTGYPTSNNLGACPQYHNIMALQNTSRAGAGVDPTGLQWFEPELYENGAQWKEGLCAGDPTSAASFAPGYTFCFGDTTNLYNRPDNNPNCDFRDVLHASRSVLWLKPDHIVCYDRATTATAGRFKRWNLQLCSAPSRSGNLTSTTSPGGQKLFVQTLLPAAASITAGPTSNYNDLAEQQANQWQLTVEDAAQPADLRFLHVLQGADAGAAQDAPTLVNSTAGTPFEGASVAGRLVLFPRQVLSADLVSVTYPAPPAAAQHYLTGLRPFSGYAVATNNGSVTVTPGATWFSDAAGVLAFDPAQSGPPLFALTVQGGSGGGNYATNRQVTITADPAPAGQAFSHWSGAAVADPKAASTTLVMPAAAATVTANFAPAYALTVQGGSGSGSYIAGQVVNIAADPPGLGQMFAQWVGAAVTSPTASATTLVMPAAAATVTATYQAAPQVTLTVQSGSGSGTYFAGQVIAITANAPPPGQTFRQWTGATVANAFSAQTTITLGTSPATVTATYQSTGGGGGQGTYPLTVLRGSGGGPYVPGAVVPIVADVAPPGWSFERWLGVGLADAKARSTTLTMPATGVTVSALFREDYPDAWELWATSADGLPRSGFPTVRVAPDGTIYVAALGDTKAPFTAGRVYRALPGSPRNFALMPQAGYAVDATNEFNASDLVFNRLGELVAIHAARTAGPPSSVPWFFRWNGAAASWSAAPSTWSGGNYLYYPWALERHPVTGDLWCIGNSPSVFISTNDGANFTPSPIGSRLPANLRGGGIPMVREYGACFGPANARHPQAVFYTVGENNGVCLTDDGGATWRSVDPHYLDPISPLARVHPTYDSSLPNQVVSGGGDGGGLGTFADGRAVVQIANAYGFGGAGPNGTGGYDGVHLYRFDLDRPDLPALVARGLADGAFGGGQSVQSQTFAVTASGWMFAETPNFPGDGQGGIYASRDGLHWRNLTRGIAYGATPKTSTNAGDALSSGGKASIGVRDDDVFMITDKGELYHHVVPGGFSVAGTVRDASLAPLAGAVVTSAYGHRTVTDALGRYTLPGLGQSHYPTTFFAASPGAAFAPQMLQVNGQHGGLDFVATAPVVASVVLSAPFSATQAGGVLKCYASVRDQFGQALEPPPAVQWSVDAGSIANDGTWTSPAGAVNATVTAQCGPVSATLSLSSSTSVPTTPWLTGVSPAAGPVIGGTVVTITGGNFLNTFGAPRVLFAGVPAFNVNVINANTLTCSVPRLTASPAFRRGGKVPVSVFNFIAANSNGFPGTLPDAFDAQPAAATSYFLNLTAGSSGGQTQLQLPAGTSVQVTARTSPGGQQFYAWTGGGAGTLADPNAATTTFTMPDHDTSLVAVYKFSPTLPALPPPQISVNAGVASLTSDPGADIYYTVDDSPPDSISSRATPLALRYQGPFAIAPGTQLRCLASAAYRPDSTVASAAIPTLFDQWRASYFGSGFAANPSAAPDADPEGDGWANLLEYSVGGDPTARTPGLAPAWQPGGSVTVTYPRRTDLASAGISLVLEWTADLNSPWSTTGVTETILNTVGNLQTIRASVPAASPHLFVRLRATAE